MLDTLLGKIAGFFEKDFLFASFLPALIFVSALVVTVAGVVSIEAIWAWVEGWTVMQRASAAVAGTLFIVVVAYILQALRASFTRGWTGNSHSMWLWGFKKVGELIQGSRYQRLKKAARNFSPWQQVLDTLYQDLQPPVWSNVFKPNANGREHLPANIKAGLEHRVDLLRVAMPVEAVKEQLQVIVDAYKTYSGDDLGDIYQAIKDKLQGWHDNEEMWIQLYTYDLDRRFGRPQFIKATTLGNVIESYNIYAFKRYKIEPDIFWPQLRKVITPDYLALVQEPKILLDFLLTMATLAVVYALLALTAGPWLWFSYWLWLPLAGLALALSYFFYRLSIGAADELGKMVRAGFDLFRLDLMAALQRPRPLTLAAEQTQWEGLSKLAVYGFSSDFALRSEAPAGFPPTP